MIGGSPNSRSYAAARRRAPSSRDRDASRRSCASPRACRRRAAPRIERRDHLGQRRVVRRARGCAASARLRRSRPPERGRRLDEIVEVGAQRERAGRHERDRVEQPRGGSSVHGSAAASPSTATETPASVFANASWIVSAAAATAALKPARGRPGRSRSRLRRAESRCGSCRRTSETSRNGTFASASRSARPSTLTAFDLPSAIPSPSGRPVRRSR